MLRMLYININDITADNYQFLRNAVSEERGKKADRYRFVEDRKRSVCAELLLQYGIYDSVGKRPVMDIGYNKYGKPYMKQLQGFHYNLSHAGEWVVVVYGSNEVGVDIEKIKPGIEKVAERFFTKEEKHFISMATAEEIEKRLTQIWTCKESYIKYLGTGLSTSLESFSVNVDSGRVHDEERKVESELGIMSLSVIPNYCLAICSIEKEIEWTEVKVDEMIQFIEEK